MPPVRRKAPRQQAPQTIEEATELLGRYSGFLTEAEQLRADADAAIARIEAARDASLAPIEEEAKGMFLQLRAWWAVAGDALTEGKRKSYELAGCLLGERTTPPSLKMPGKADEAAATLVREGLAGFCRHKVEVDKPAVLKAIADLPKLRDALDQAKGKDFGEAMTLSVKIEHVEKVLGLGFRVTQKVEFFIDRAAPKPAAVEEVREAAE